MLNIIVNFAWSFLTGDKKSACLKALRALLMLCAPFATSWLHAHGVDSTAAGAFVSQSVGYIMAATAIIGEIWDWYSVKQQTRTASSGELMDQIPPDITGSTVKLDPLEQRNLQQTSKS